MVFQAGHEYFEGNPTPANKVMGAVLRTLHTQFQTSTGMKDIPLPSAAPEVRPNYLETDGLGTSAAKPLDVGHYLFTTVADDRLRVPETPNTGTVMENIDIGAQLQATTAGFVAVMKAKLPAAAEPKRERWMSKARQPESQVETWQYTDKDPSFTRIYSFEIPYVPGEKGKREHAVHGVKMVIANQPDKEPFFSADFEFANNVITKITCARDTSGEKAGKQYGIYPPVAVDRLIGEAQAGSDMTEVVQRKAREIISAAYEWSKYGVVIDLAANPISITKTTARENFGKKSSETSRYTYNVSTGGFDCIAENGNTTSSSMTIDDIRGALSTIMRMVPSWTGQA